MTELETLFGQRFETTYSMDEDCVLSWTYLCHGKTKENELGKPEPT